MNNILEQIQNKAVSGLIELKRKEKAEELNRNISLAWWTKVAAIAAIVGALAAITAAILAFLTWRYPMTG